MDPSSSRLNRLGWDFACKAAQIREREDLRETCDGLQKQISELQRSRRSPAEMANSLNTLTSRLETHRARLAELDQVHANAPRDILDLLQRTRFAVLQVGRLAPLFPEVPLLTVCASTGAQGAQGSFRRDGSPHPRL